METALAAQCTEFPINANWLVPVVGYSGHDLCHSSATRKKNLHVQKLSHLQSVLNCSLNLVAISGEQASQREILPYSADSILRSLLDYSKRNTGRGLAVRRSKSCSPPLGAVGPNREAWKAYRYLR